MGPEDLRNDNVAVLGGQILSRHDHDHTKRLTRPLPQFLPHQPYRIDLDQGPPAAATLDAPSLLILTGGNTMAQPPQAPGAAGADGADDEPIPPLQRVLDNPFLLLFLGVTVPTVFYLIWGIMEITQIPIAP
jgi:hypothetical protein